MISLNGFSTKFTLSPVDGQKETEISNLIDGLFISEQAVDSAFAIAKTIEASTSLHFMLSNVCNAYLKLQTEDGCSKAYQVAKFKEQKVANVSILLDSIIEVCIQLKTIDAITLAEEIYKDNSDCLKYSSNKNYFQVVKKQVERQYFQIKPKIKPREATNVKIEQIVEKDKAIPRLISKFIRGDCDDACLLEAFSIALTQNENITEAIFNSIKSSDLESLNNQFVGLDTIQKSKYFTSTMKFVTPWAEGDEEMTPLQFASHLGNMDAVKFFVESGASVNDFRNTSDSTQRNSLHFAIDEGHIDIALFLISKGAKDKLASSETSHALKQYQLPKEFGGSHSCLSALHMSIIKNWHEVVKELLKTGNSNIQEKASGINTPLHLAARGGDEEMVKLLLSFGAEKALSIKNSDKKTPKEMASKHNHDHLLTLLT